MTPRERVRAALNHEQPDFTPCDYYATPEIHTALARHFGLPAPKPVAGVMGGGAGSLEDGGVAERLGTDLRYVAPPYIGPPQPNFDDGSSMNLWGLRRRPMANQYGEYAEPVGSSLRGLDDDRPGRALALAQPRLVRLRRAAVAVRPLS